MKKITNEPKDGPTCDSGCWTHTEHSLVCDYRRAKMRSTAPLDVRKAAERIVGELGGFFSDMVDRDAIVDAIADELSALMEGK